MFSAYGRLARKVFKNAGILPALHVKNEVLQSPLQSVSRYFYI